MDIDLTRIKAGFSAPEGQKASCELYVQSIEKLIKKIIPPGVFPKDPLDLDTSCIEEYFTKFHKHLPLLVWSALDSSVPQFISIALICEAAYTQGIGRYMCEAYSKWSVPGKQLPVVNVRSMAFQFLAYPKNKYFINELVLEISEIQDIAILRTTLPNLAKEMKHTALAVQHARHVVSVKPLSLEQKKILIQENLASLIDRQSKDFENTIFEQVHHLLIKASAENKVTQLREKLAPMLELRPTVFDQDIFHEIQQVVLNFKDSFTALRDIKHLNRIISYLYLFRKILTTALSSNNAKQNLSVKITRSKLHTPYGVYPVLGLVVGIILKKENELFEERHLLKAIQSCLPHVVHVKDSTVADRRPNDRIRTLYLEIEKLDHTAFNASDIRELRKRVAREIKSRIETVSHSVFIHRNDEEVMRDILDLSKQLRYVHDLPQVIVSFHKQTDFEVSFIVVILRLLKSNDENMRTIFTHSSTLLKIVDHDVKIVGNVRKRYPKEANVFEIRLDKKQFLRKDFSLDLYKARSCVISEITRMIGDVRDYNGGMISKQYEVLAELKAILLKVNIRNDFLLENFFYSLHPSYMQSLLSPPVLKRLFLMLLEIIDRDFSSEVYCVKKETFSDFFLVMIAAIHPSFKDFITETLSHLDTSPYDLSYTSITTYDITTIGLILRFEDVLEYTSFFDKIQQALLTWQETIENPHYKSDQPFIMTENFVK